MNRLTVDQILKPGAKMEVRRIDFDDPANAHIKELFEQTKKQQEKLIKLRDQPFENSLITI